MTIQAKTAPPEQVATWENAVSKPQGEYNQKTTQNQGYILAIETRLHRAIFAIIRKYFSIVEDRYAGRDSLSSHRIADSVISLRDQMREVAL